MAKKEQAIMPVMPKKYETMWNFGQADDDRTGTLRGAAEAYNSGKDWTGITNGLQGNGNFVGYYDEAGAPTGAFYSLSGNANGSMLWGLGGNMANTGVDEGSLLQFSGDKSYWTVGPDGKLNPYQAAVADADAGMGGVPDYGTRGMTGNDAVPGSGGTKASYSESSSYSSGGNPYAAYLDAFDYGPAPEWGGTEYERRRDEALRRAENMQFNYDPSTDPSWLAYQKQYRREGQRATADALGQAAALTGGVPSSYAVTAASQAGDYYASQLSDKLPQLYQDAYNRYLQEYQRQLGIADAYAGYGQTEYNRYLDRLGQYNTDRNFAYGQFRDQIGDQRYADERDYERSEKERQWEYQQALDEYNRGQDALNWDYKNRAYADEQTQQRYNNALKFYSQFGYIPEEYADLFSSWAGMGQQEQTPQVQYVYLQDPNTEPPETPPAGEGETNGGYVEMPETGGLNSGTWEIINAVENGLLTEAEADNILSRMGLGTYRSLREKTGGFVHNDATNTAMSDGFRRVWPKLRNDFDKGVGKQTLREKILKYLDDGTITNDDAWVIINQLGLDED